MGHEETKKASHEDTKKTSHEGTKVALWCGLLCAAAAALVHSAAPTPAELAQALQRKYNTVKDFSADFTQVYRGGVLNKEVTERGTLLVKKPGKMRWEYRSPEQKLYVSDGVKLYAYIPEDKQVQVNSVPPEDQATTPTLFLAGKGDLTRDFTPSMTEPPRATPPGTLALKLVPKKPQPDYDWLVLAFEPDTYRLRGLVTSDTQGGLSTFSFTNLKENVGLADKAFEFTPPRGVDVIMNSPAR
jgi:outer membrane lipoprotein carrier protein